MFNVYEHIFGIQIQELQPPSKYVDDLKLYAVIDKDSRAPLGLLYMDMFPRAWQIPSLCELFHDRREAS